MAESEAYIKIFFEEVIEISENLEESLLNYEKEKSEEVDTQIRRNFHTLKGDFATFDIEKYTKFFHVAEDKWISGTDKSEVIQEVLDKLNEVKEFIRIAEESGFDAALAADLDSNSKKITSFDQLLPKSEIDIHATVVDKIENEVHNDIDKTETSGFLGSGSNPYMQVFFEEVNEITDFLEESLLNYEEQESEELNKDIKRNFHTLKGDFATFNIEKFSKFFHTAEDRWKAEENKKEIINDVLNALTEVKAFMNFASENGIEEALKNFCSDEPDEENIPADSKTIQANATNDNLTKVELKADENSENNSNNIKENINTFILKFYEEKSLKLKEIEQLFNFYGKIKEVQKGGKGEYKIVVDMPDVNEVRGMLEVLLLGEGEFTIVSGRPVDKKKKLMSKNTTELQGIKAVRVETKILDDILNTMSELIIKHSSLKLYKDHLTGEARESYKELIEKISETTKIFQKDIFAIRLVQIKILFYQLRRVVRDISHELDKSVDFEIIGEDTKLDKSILEKIAPPLKHMIKNSMDHGIESRGERLRKGKSLIGKIKVDAYQENDEVIIEVYDDGGGMDINEIYKKALEKKIIEDGTKLTEDEIFALIFAPGFSTSDYVTEISGRGIGMDIVKNTVDELNGKIEIESEKDIYTRFKIRIPATVSIINSFLIEDRSDKYIIPVSNVVEILDSQSRQVRFEDKLYYEEKSFNIISLKENSNTDLSRKIILLIQTGNGIKALGVDDILDSQDFIIRDMNIISDTLKRYSGVTILANGEVALALNPRAL